MRPQAELTHLKRIPKYKQALRRLLEIDPNRRLSQRRQIDDREPGLSIIPRVDAKHQCLVTLCHDAIILLRQL